MFFMCIDCAVGRVKLNTQNQVKVDNLTRILYACSEKVRYICQI